MIFGYIDYVITGDSFTKFFSRIMSKKLPVSKMCEKNGKLTLRMPAEHCKALERLCDGGQARHHIHRQVKQLRHAAQNTALLPVPFFLHALTSPNSMRKFPPACLSRRMNRLRPA